MSKGRSQFYSIIYCCLLCVICMSLFCCIACFLLLQIGLCMREETGTKRKKKKGRKAEVCREDREAGGETQRREEQGCWYTVSAHTGLQVLNNAGILINLGLKLNAEKKKNDEYILNFCTLKLGSFGFLRGNGGFLFYQVENNLHCSRAVSAR